jgi:CHAT domain-containing protein
MIFRGFAMILRPLIVSALILAGASCARPPASAYDTAAGTGPAGAGTPIGQNTAGETCTSQPANGGLDVYCGNWDQPSAQVRAGGPAAAADLSALATTSPWRAALEGSYACGTPQPGTVLDGEPAAYLACSQRIGGWPHVALVALIGGQIYYGDGVAPALPPMQRAMGVLSGRVAPAAAGAAPVATSDSALASRLAAEAYSSGDIGKYNSLMAVGSQSNQAEDFPSAIIAYRAALALQQAKIGASNPGTLAPMLELALNLSDAAQYPEAGSLLMTAQHLVPQSNDPTARAKLLHYEGLDQLNQGHDKAALVQLQAAEAAYDALLPAEILQAQQTDQNAALSTVADTGAGPGLDTSQARLNSPITQAALLGAIEALRYEAIAENALGDHAGSLKAVDASERLADSNDLAPVLLGARLDRTDATLAAANGKNGAALAQFSAARSNFSDALPGSLPIAETDLLAAGVEQSAGEIDAAVTSCDQAVSLLATLRLGADPELVGPCLESYAAAAATNPAAADGLHDKMFEAAELAQGSVTAQEIGAASARLSTSASNPKVSAAIRTQQDEAAKLAALYQQRDNFSKGSAAPGGTLASLDRDIATATAALKQDDLAVQAAAPNFGQLVQQVVSVRDVLAALRPDEGFLGITTTPRTTWLFLFHGNQLQVGSTKVGATQMAGLVKSVRDSIEPTTAGLPRFDMEDAHRIYLATLGPFAATMTGIHELTVAPSGALLALPFALLPTTAADSDDLGGAPWLVRQTNLAYVPAAANFVSLRRIEGSSAATRPWFGFGDFQPVTPAQARATYAASTCGPSAAAFAALPRLPFATLELKAGAAIFNARPADELLGPDFTVPKVEAASLKDYKILHFATHALLPTDLPCQAQPAIVTSAPANAPSAADALLNTGDVANLHLDANLVILSACNTGGGEAGGEALSGLARSFFFAGARALMVTQWSVNDQVSAYLVADTLNRLHDGEDGGPAGALRAAQLALIGGAAQGMPANISNPFFWAAFSVIGDGGAAPRAKLSALSPAPRAGL